MTTASNQHFEVLEKLVSLEEALKANTPNIATLLRDIHAKLKADPDVVTILSEEQVAVIVKGLQKQTSTTIAATALKKAKNKSTKSITVDDL